MLRTLFWFIYFFLYLIYSIPSLWKANALLKKEELFEHYNHVKNISSKWANSLLKVAGVTVHIHGKENIPQNETCIIICNHQGNFDIPILLGSLDRKLGFISKVEVKKLPVIRSWMKHLHCVFIDRKNRRQSIQAIIEGVNNLKDGHDLVIFPEGTRSKGKKMAPFKKGSIKLATRSKATILPVTIDGSYLVMEENGGIIRPNDVNLYISKPIRLHQEADGMDENELKDIVQQTIEGKIRKQ
ncbi:lysophospholipid acyltransferase family protein [Evansella sp. AB-P1]|uniref:lysophospholipid acyltransferase family protein n=1 Tax=Evansella sp. AB-P1 TaxID=3037653 RepID=UPI00241FCC1F|nr:lysophospholipid acyltransferase family protein [Evansella sp. AB-P1]MDG5786112.1 lysophospholipid acyltransferase family protein [Evansella sp. AB-P1]